MHPRWASLVAWQSSKPKAQTSHRKTPAVSHLDPSRLQPQQTTVPSLFPEPPLPCAYPPAEPTEVQEDGSHTGPQTRERGKTTGERVYLASNSEVQLLLLGSQGRENEHIVPRLLALLVLNLLFLFRYSLGP